MSSPLPLICTLIAESEALITLAESANWDVCASLEQTRQAKLKTLDLQHVELSEQEHQQVQIKMQHLIQLNTQLKAVCQQQRTETIGELSKLTAGSRAKKAYS